MKLKIILDQNTPKLQDFKKTRKSLIPPEIQLATKYTVRLPFLRT